MTCRWDLSEFVCKAPIWFLSHRTECHIHHFHVRQEIWKAHLRGDGWDDFHCVVHHQYVVSSCLFKRCKCLPKKGDLTARAAPRRAGRSAPTARPRSTPGFAAPLRPRRLPLTLSTPALLCEQMFCLWCQLLAFSHLAKGIRSSREVSRKVRPPPAQWESCARIPRGSSSQATTPVMRCSEQRRRTTEMLMAALRQQDTCWGKRLGLLCQSASADTLRTLNLSDFSALAVFWNLGDKSTKMPSLLGPFVRCSVGAMLLVLWLIFAGVTCTGELQFIYHMLSVRYAAECLFAC